MAVLSIITPTYNRAQLLPRCYASLLEQTCFDFEWIIVDDGSTDDTENVVSAFSTEAFPIIYIKKENGGKHTALNASHSMIHGKYVLILDSDDYLTKDAVFRILSQWEQHENALDVGMLIFLKGFAADDPLCKAEMSQTPVDLLRCPRTRIHSTDCCEVVRTDLFITYPFPVFEGERFIPESALWERVGLGHKCVYINEVIYLCEYLEGGLTKAGRSLRIRNPYGEMFVSDLRMDSRYRLTQRLKNGALYNCYSLFANLSFVDTVKRSQSKVLAAACRPIGWGLYIRWKRHL